MAFRKTADDEWTPTGVKSTFTIDVPENPSSQAIGTPTAICGWGWRFSCAIAAASSSTSPKLIGTDSSVIPWRRVDVFFHPDVIRKAAYGRITFLTHVENLLPLDDVLFYNEFDVPDDSATNPPIGVYMHRSDTWGAAMISISVEFRAVLGMALPRPLDARVEEALADTIRGDEVVDVKFYAYTRRIGSSYVARPRPMFAKMALLRGHSDDLDAYLSGISGGEGFLESTMVDLDLDMPEEERFAEYDYMSDSDLDTDDEEDELLTGHSAENVPLPPSRPRSPALTAPRRMGHVVVVKGHAFKTWNALLYYLYTKKIVFSSSEYPHLADRASLTPKCSAKSVYKLADAFGLGELKHLALTSLRSQLSAGNIVHEAFSSFTSVYPEIRDIEVEFLINHLPSLTGEIDKMLRSICDGARPQCFDVLRKVVCRTGSAPALPRPNTPSRPSAPETTQTRSISASRAVTPNIRPNRWSRRHVGR
ncbi:hypothetical protein B0H10DRAFT_2182929 [Mycena sp. CBHHK59/15]|nr:hypothetical protein B0H10DRAFT_2182929 [Mycena sp. CBHHK59/15]